MPDKQMDERLEHWNPVTEPTGDGWEVLRYARDECPFSHSDAEGGFWMATTSELVQTILHRPEVFSSSDGITLPHRISPIPKPPIDIDPPLQSSFRRLLNTYLTPNALRPHEDAVRKVARDLLDQFVDNGACEFMSEFAQPFPMLVLAQVILGVDVEYLSRARERMNARSGNTPPGNYQEFLQGLCTEIIHERREQEPDDSIVSAVLHGTVENRPLTELEQVGSLMILVLGGLSTTTDAFGNIIARVIDDPTIEDRLRQPNWVATDLDEFLRIDAPVQWIARTVAQPFELAGVTLQPGEKVMAYLASANRDQNAYEDPDEVRFDRDHQRHVSFGLGAHRCIGSNVARFELGIGFEEILSRVTKFRLQPGVEILRQSGMGNGPKTLPVEFELIAAE